MTFPDLFKSDLILITLCLECSLKVPLWSNSWYCFFLHFVHKKFFVTILRNFNLLRTLEFTFFGPLFIRIYGRHYFSMFQVLVKNLGKWRNFPKNITWDEIIIIINTVILIRRTINLSSYIREIFYTNYDCNLNPRDICEKMTSLT